MTCEPFIAPKVVGVLNCHRNTARNKLEDLVFLIELEMKKVSLAGRVYWSPGSGCEGETAASGTAITLTGEPMGMTADPDAAEAGDGYDAREFAERYIEEHRELFEKLARE